CPCAASLSRCDHRPDRAGDRVDVDALARDPARFRSVDDRATTLTAGREMAVQPKETARRVEALELLAEAGVTAATSRTLGEALGAVADAVVRAGAADVVVIRIVDTTAASMIACAVAGDSPAV